MVNHKEIINRLKQEDKSYWLMLIILSYINQTTFGTILVVIAFGVLYFIQDINTTKFTLTGLVLLAVEALTTNKDVKALVETVQEKKGVDNE